MKAKMKKRSIHQAKTTSAAFRGSGKVSIVPDWIASWQWWVLILAAFVILSLEAYDFSRKLNDPIHEIELAIFLVLLLVIGLLLVSLSRGIRNQNRIIRILEAKGKLGLELSGYIDWDVLVDQIARLPRTLADVSQTCLYVSNLITNKFDLVAQWNRAQTDPTDACTSGPCEEFIGKGPGTELVFSQCKPESVAGEALSQNQIFCLPIKDFGKPFGGFTIYT